MRRGWRVLLVIVALGSAGSEGFRPPAKKIVPMVVGALSGDVGNVCRGSQLAQAPRDVTGEFSQVGTGVKITQLTTQGANFITYVDVPAFSPAANAIVYNNMPGGVVTASLDGTNAQLIAGPATAVHLSWDGRLAIFNGPGATRRSMDIYAVALDKPNRCAEYRITDDSFEITPGVGPLKISLPVAYGDKEVIAIAPTHFLRRVLSDGKYLDPEPGVDPSDPYHGNPIHRLRLNPKFPQWIAYSRNAGMGPRGTPENWLYNFETQQLCSVAPLGKSYGHDSWSPDGTKLGLGAGGPGTWNVAAIFDAQGKLLGECSAGKYGDFSVETVGENVASHRAGLAANFCAWPPDDAPVFVCVSARQTGMKIYLLATDGHGVKFLANSDSRAGSDKGIPVAVFARDSRHILFRSDKTGTPQVYMITGFTPSVP